MSVCPRDAWNNVLPTEEQLESEPVSASPPHGNSEPRRIWLCSTSEGLHYLDMWSVERGVGWGGGLFKVLWHSPNSGGAFMSHWARSGHLALHGVEPCQNSEKMHLEILNRIPWDSYKSCKFLHVGLNSPWIGPVWDCLAGRLDVSPQRALAAMKINCRLNRICENATTRSRQEIFFPLISKCVTASGVLCPAMDPSIQAKVIINWSKSRWDH